MWLNIKNVSNSQFFWIIIKVQTFLERIGGIPPRPAGHLHLRSALAPTRPFLYRNTFIYFLHAQSLAAAAVCVCRRLHPPPKKTALQKAQILCGMRFNGIGLRSPGAGPRDSHAYPQRATKHVIFHRFHDLCSFGADATYPPGPAPAPSCRSLSLLSVLPAARSLGRASHTFCSTIAFEQQGRATAGVAVRSRAPHVSHILGPIWPAFTFCSTYSVIFDAIADTQIYCLQI